MAGGAKNFLFCKQGLHNIAMAKTTGIFGDLSIMWFDLNGFMKLASGKGKGMPKPIFCLVQIFSNQSMGIVTVIAGCGISMASFYPSRILVLHDMAVHTGFGIV